MLNSRRHFIALGRSFGILWKVAGQSWEIEDPFARDLALATERRAAEAERDPLRAHDVGEVALACRPPPSRAESKSKKHKREGPLIALSHFSPKEKGGPTQFDVVAAPLSRHKQDEGQAEEWTDRAVISSPACTPVRNPRRHLALAPLLTGGPAFETDVALCDPANPVRAPPPRGLRLFSTMHSYPPRVPLSTVYCVSFPAVLLPPPPSATTFG